MVKLAFGAPRGEWLVQATFTTAQTLRITVTAARCAQALGFTLEDVVTIVAIIAPTNFYKAMTSDANPTVWQDVYHVPYAQLVLYVKFTVDAQGHLLISFKEK